MGKYVRGLDYMELEGGGAGGGAGGRYTSSGKKPFDATKDASDTIVKGLGIPLLVAGAGSGIKKIMDQPGDYAKDREAAAEMKRETRGVQKTSNDRAREAQAESTRQNKINKAAEDASKNMAKGGMTASRRADGCCTKGKTRGKYL